MPVIPFIPAIITGVSSVVGAHQASKGQTKAADIESQTADKDRAEQTRIYEQQRSDTSPYRSAGVNSVGAMSSLLGLPDPGGVGPQSAPQTPPAWTPAQPGTGMLSHLVNYAQNVQSGAERPAQPTDSSYVTIASPTGQTKQVPSGELDHWISKGAKKVVA